MAPLRKTRRRATQEIEELNWWFTDVLTDRSNFFRYDNVEYPELTLEEAMNCDESYIIDDEFLITYDLDNWRRIERLNADQVETADRANDENNPRWQRFRRAIPVFITVSTILMLLPALWAILTGMVSAATGWFKRHRKLDGEDLPRTTDEEERYFDEFTKSTVRFTSPNEYLLQQRYDGKSGKNRKVVYGRAKDTEIIYVNGDVPPDSQEGSREHAAGESDVVISIPQ